VEIFEGSLTACPHFFSHPLPAFCVHAYLEANARYQAKVSAGQSWDERTGLALLGEDVDHRVAAERQYVERLART
jgi:hypothetical protein